MRSKVSKTSKLDVRKTNEHRSLEASTPPTLTTEGQTRTRTQTSIPKARGHTPTRTQTKGAMGKETHFIKMK